MCSSHEIQNEPIFGMTFQNVSLSTFDMLSIRGGNLLESLDSIRIDSWGHDSIKNRFTIVSIHDSKSILDSKTILQFESNFDFIYIIYLYFIPVCGLVFFCSYLTVMDSPKERKIPLHQKPEIYFVSFSCTLNNLVYIYIYIYIYKRKQIYIFTKIRWWMHKLN